MGTNGAIGEYRIDSYYRSMVMMNPFNRTYFPKRPKYAREFCILTCIFGALCAITILIGAPAWISAMFLCIEVCVCAIGIYRSDSYGRSK